MNLIIDPYMLELQNEDEIKENISFFRVLCYLCKSNKINIVLYKELADKLTAREVKPFPIYIGKIKDDDLRTKIQSLNKFFISLVMRNILPIDIDQCSGNQEFLIDSEENRVYECLRQDEKYFELLSILLQPCYNEEIQIYDCIAKGRIEKGLRIGDRFSLKCQCQCKSTFKEYEFSAIDRFTNEEDRAYIALDQQISEEKNLFIVSPQIVRGNHHNKLQSNSDFTTYEGLSRVNKSVISLLRRFGLSKIIFGEFHEDSSYTQGTIYVCDVKKNMDNDIVKGWLFAETGFKNHVDLYFPKNIGENLKVVLKNVFEKNNVQRLYDSLF